ncbi:MAG: DUF3618 domain-containing protein [Jiangellaceae bacterium]
MPAVEEPARARARKPAEIEQELQETTDRLAARVDELVDRVHPRQVARRSVASVREKLTTPQGNPRPEVVGAAIGALIGLAVLVWRARRHR